MSQDFPSGQGEPRDGAETLVRRELARRGAGLDRAPLGLDQVRRRARSIRRRRQGGALLAVAAAVLVIVVPLRAALGGGWDRDPAPAHESTSTPSPQPEETITGTLTFTGHPAGDAPEVPWIQGREIHLADRTVPTEHTYTDVAVLGDRIVAQRPDGRRVDVLEEDGTVRSSYPSGYGPLVTNDDLTVVAWIGRDRRPRYLQPEMGEPGIGRAARRGSGPQAVAVTGQGCEGDGDGCAIWFTTDSREGRESWVWDSRGFLDVARPPGQALLDVSDADDRRQVLGLLRSVDDMAWCSELRDEQQRRWQTCDHMPLSFSPDRQHVLATHEIGFEGFGTGELAVLHTESGFPVLDLVSESDPDRPEGPTITDMTWEDEDSVLAILNQGREWAILRIGLDGSTEYAAGPTQAAPFSSPYALGTRP
ncbi:hypothetical protein [Nocardioides insulae]|uniref:hypothetical protein n=1 Tax=Nocardioides insulae TaxID=394734 RepID=UPI0004194CDE|nr:hypothetical protein [Nocardioides insulae]